MTNAQKFIFGQDFRQGPPKRFTESELAQAEQAAYERGFAAGRRAEDLALQDRQAMALERMAALAAGLLADAEATRAEAEKAAVDFALTFATRLADAAISRAPLAPIVEAISRCFAHLATMPHLAARVNASLVEETERLLNRVAEERGFAGKIIVIGDPDMPPGDVRLEWAEGAIIRDRAEVERRIGEAVSAWAADPATKR